MESRTVNSLAIVIPVYNEEPALEGFHQQLVEVLDALKLPCGIYYVNDGSSDGTDLLLQKLAGSDPRITAIELSRNFGHQAALSAGMDYTREEVIITLDGDGQHPPTAIPEMLSLYASGYDIVITRRLDSQTGGLLKRWSSSTFYRLINQVGDTRVPEGSSDFRLLSRQALEGLKKMPEYHRFLRGMVAWMGFRSVILPYLPPARLAGRSKYSLGKMFGLASHAVFSFSLVPIRIILGLGVVFLVLAVLEIIYVLSFWLRGAQASLEPGWSSLMFVILFVGGVMMASLGVIGIYIGYIFQEVKNRPVYLVRSVHGKELHDR